MRAFAVFIGLCLVALTTTEKIDVSPQVEFVNLIPKTGSGTVESHFDLHSPFGSKMMLTCVFQSHRCSAAKLKIYDGKSVTNHCALNYPYFMMNSYKNKMSVTFQNAVKSVGAFCQVSATRPYMNFPEKLIDSSEHGMTHLSKKKNTCRCGWTNKTPSRIVGGKEAGINEYPFSALIRAGKFKYICGGSIITERHILTAAHCTEDHRFSSIEPLNVIVGEHDVRTEKETSATKFHDVVKIYQHENYDYKNQVHDISLLEVDPKIEFNDKVGPVCMPSLQQSYVGDFVKAMGWGYTKHWSELGDSSPVLMKVDLRVIHPEVCEKIFRIDTSKLTQICTYNHMKDSCQGDSGGPLVRLNSETNMYEQIGLVSFGKKCATTDPAVNTDVAAHLHWIKQQIGDKGTMCF